jgi:hypothetical protein
MTPHAHITPIHLAAAAIFTFAALGTVHLLILPRDNRASRAVIALGF